MQLNIEDLSFTGNNPGAAKFGNFINYYSFHSSKERINNLHPKMFPHTENEQIHCLDIGCNSGELTEDLYVYLKTIYPKSEINVLAIDIDPALIERAREQNAKHNISFVTSDISTEMVTMWIHINNGDLGLQKFLKFIKDNSRSVIVEPQPWKCYKNAQRRMKRSGKSFELYESLNIRDNVDKQIEDILTDKTYIKVYESPSSSWNRKIQSYHLIQ